MVEYFLLAVILFLDLQELVLQQVAFKALIDRNRERCGTERPANAVHLPFVVINADRSTDIKSHVSPDQSQFHFEFSGTRCCDFWAISAKKKGPRRGQALRPSQCSRCL